MEQPRSIIERMLREKRSKMSQNYTTEQLLEMAENGEELTEEQYILLGRGVRRGEAGSAMQSFALGMEQDLLDRMGKCNEIVEKHLLSMLDEMTATMEELRAKDLAGDASRFPRTLSGILFNKAVELEASVGNAPPKLSEDIKAAIERGVFDHLLSDAH